MARDDDYELVDEIDKLAERLSHLLAAIDNAGGSRKTKTAARLLEACPFKVMFGEKDTYYEALVTLLQETLVWGDRCRAELGLDKRDWGVWYADSLEPQTRGVIVKPSGLYEPSPEEDYD